jgi:hypothetical protein
MLDMKPHCSARKWSHFKAGICPVTREIGRRTQRAFFPGSQLNREGAEIDEYECVFVVKTCNDYTRSRAESPGMVGRGTGTRSETAGAKGIFVEKTA